MTKRTIKPAEGKLGVLLPGMGAVTSTFIAGIELMAVSMGPSSPVATNAGRPPRCRTGRRQMDLCGARAAGRVTR